MTRRLSFRARDACPAPADLIERAGVPAFTAGQDRVRSVSTDPLGPTVTSHTPGRAVRAGSRRADLVFPACKATGPAVRRIRHGMHTGPVTVREGTRAACREAVPIGAYRKPLTSTSALTAVQRIAEDIGTRTSAA